ncbi:MAG TPA: CHAT domain-containing protein, partial [Pirellulales bacterium]|nr:CHAT domain-containing protein [Pirellulales bacterium]
MAFRAVIYAILASVALGLPAVCVGQVARADAVLISLDAGQTLSVRQLDLSRGPIGNDVRGILVCRTGTTERWAVVPQSEGDSQAQPPDNAPTRILRAAHTPKLLVSPAQEALFRLDELNLPDVDARLTPPGNLAAPAGGDAKNDRTSAYLNEIARLTGGRASPLYRLLAGYYLLGHGEQSPTAPTRVPNENVDELVVHVRRLIARGEWQNALDLTAPLDRLENARARAMAMLLRGAIYAEDDLREADSASRDGPAADPAEYFDAALTALAGGPRRDLAFAHGQYGGYLLRMAEDGLNDDVFRIAARSPSPLLDSLTNWLAARDHYQQALALSDDAEDRAAMRLSLARADTLLADVIRTLHATRPVDAATIDDCLRAAERQAAELAQPLAHQRDEASGSPLSAAARQILAHLAYRSGDYPRAIELASQAEAAYLAIGSLPGLESVHRLLGLALDHISRGTASTAQAGSAAKDALRHLLISHLITDVLRDRFPPDRIGLSRAGFLARRADVTEKIVELLIAEGRDAEALHYAESAKARALEDALAARLVKTGRRPAAPHEIRRALAHWPAGAAALEYFLGSEKAWVFVIDKTGGVRALPLVDSSRKSIEPGDLISRVEAFLTGIRFQAAKMKARLLAGQGFDHSWQDVLDRFRRELLPPGALDAVRGAEPVVVAPHYILHYFPFAALVTRPDREKRGADEMVRPRFLLDEGLDLCHVPALVAWLDLRGEPLAPLAQAAAIGIADYPGAPRIPGVLKDLNGLKTAFGDKVAATFLGKESLESKAQALLARPGVCLMATHGSNLADDPLESFLLFYPDADDDGRLRAVDVYESQVAADLVALRGYPKTDIAVSRDFADLFAHPPPYCKGVHEMSDETLPRKAYSSDLTD